MLRSKILHFAQILKEHCRYEWCEPFIPASQYANFLSQAAIGDIRRISGSKQAPHFASKPEPGVTVHIPFAWVIGRLWFQCSCLFMGAYLVWYSCATVVAFKEYGSVLYKSFRMDAGFYVEGLSESNDGIQNCTLTQFQLLLGGCAVWASENVTAFAQWNQIKSPSITLSRALRVDGMALTLPYQPNSSSAQVTKICLYDMTGQPGFQ
jgi:hypothetical protein